MSGLSYEGPTGFASIIDFLPSERTCPPCETVESAIPWPAFSSIFTSRNKLRSSQPFRIGLIVGDSHRFSLFSLFSDLILPLHCKAKVIRSCLGSAWVSKMFRFRFFIGLPKDLHFMNQGRQVAHRKAENLHLLKPANGLQFLFLTATGAFVRSD